LDQKNQKCVLYDGTRRLIAEHWHLDNRVFSSSDIKHRADNLFTTSEFSVGTPGCKEFYRLLCQILNPPSEQPTIASDFPIPTKLLYGDPGFIMTHGAHPMKIYGFSQCRESFSSVTSNCEYIYRRA
jgi:hypothetical protein